MGSKYSKPVRHNVWSLPYNPYCANMTWLKIVDYHFLVIGGLAGAFYYFVMAEDAIDEAFQPSEFELKQRQYRKDLETALAKQVAGKDRGTRMTYDEYLKDFKYSREDGNENMIQKTMVNYGLDDDKIKRSLITEVKMNYLNADDKKKRQIEAEHGIVRKED